MHRISFKDFVTRVLVLGVIFFAGWVAAYEQVRRVDYYYWLSDAGLTFGIVLTGVIAFVTLLHLARPRALWLLSIPFVFACAVFLHLVTTLPVTIKTHDVIVDNRNEVIRPFRHRDEKQLKILTGFGRYRIVRGVYVDSAQVHQLSVAFYFSDEAILAWESEKPMNEQAIEILKKIVEPVTKEKRKARLAFLKDGLEKRFCEELKSLVKTSSCALSTLRFNAGYSETLWSDRFTAEEAIEERLPDVAARLLDDRHFREGDELREKLLNVVLEETDGPASRPYNIVTSRMRLKPEESKRLWDAVYSRRDAACTLMRALRDMRYISEDERARMRATIKATKEPACAQRLIWDERRHEIGIELNDEEKTALRLLIVRGSNAELADKLLNEGKTLDEVERAIWFEELLKDKFVNMFHALQRNKPELTLVERAQLLARAMEFRPTDFETGEVSPTTLFALNLSAAERAGLISAMKAKASESAESAVRLVRLASTQRGISNEEYGELADILMTKPPIHTARLVKEQDFDYRSIRSRLILYVSNGGDKAACRMILDSFERIAQYDRRQVPEAQVQAIKRCLT